MHISKLQFKAEGPNFNAELVPVHSPLLRESCLVSYPPLTYMLKFSGFADLTSYQGTSHAVGQVTPHNQLFKPKQPTNSPRVLQQQQAATIAFCQSRTARRQMLCMHQGHRAPWCTDAACRLTAPHCQGTHRQHETKVDSEAGMLSGLSQKRSIRSNPCWFTEFCKSQCISHFAAPFIDV